MLQRCAIGRVHQTGFFLVDATLKGIRTCLMNHGRCSVTSDELVNTYHTPWSEVGTGVNYLSRAKLNTFLNCERDDVMTGLGATHLSKYSFQHKVAGQLPAAEWVMKTAPHGSHKRMTFVISEDCPPRHTHQAWLRSEKFVRDVHEWMQSHASLASRRHTLDGYALSMYRAVEEAIDDFINDDTSRLPDGLSVKLGFADTDLMRYTNVNMRYMQNLESIRFPEARATDRTRANVHEFAMALHLWLRQIRTHAAFYKYMESQRLTASAQNNPEKGLAAAICGGGPVTNPAMYLQGMDRAMHHIMKHPKTKAPFSSVQVREAIKNLKGVRDGAGSALAISGQAVDALVKGGLLVVTTEGPPVRGKRGPKRRDVRTFARSSWDQVQQSEASKALAARLRLGSDDFGD